MIVLNVILSIWNYRKKLMWHLLYV